MNDYDDQRIYHADDFPEGLRCIECGTVFVEGQPISERLVGMTEYEDDPAFVVELVCVGCGLA